MAKKFFSSRLIKFLAVAAICLLLIFLNPHEIFNPIRGVFLKISQPFQKGFYFIGDSTKGLFSFLGSIGDLNNQNEQLIKENNSLVSRLADLKDVQKENEMLRQQLNLAPRQKYDLEASFVIGQDPQLSGSWLMIDKGSASGIKPGMPVIYSDGILVGKIDNEISPDSAKVDLLSDADSAVNAMDVNTSAKGIVKGEYGLGLLLDMVDQSAVLNVGDTVVTSGLGGAVPEGLFIGTVQQVRLSQDKLFQQAVITPRVKYSNLDMVFVIKN